MPLPARVLSVQEAIYATGEQIFVVALVKDLKGNQNITQVAKSGQKQRGEHGRLSCGYVRSGAPSFANTGAERRCDGASDLPWTSDKNSCEAAHAV